MTLHLIKLCVGGESVEDLAEFQRRRARQGERELGRRVSWHVTRMVPKRSAELIDGGGSLYWVIKGHVRARQRLAGLREIVDSQGRRACVLELDPEVVKVQPRQHRPFQGWRYLPGEKAPPDLADAPQGVAEMPAWMVAELKELGLL